MLRLLILVCALLGDAFSVRSSRRQSFRDRNPVIFDCHKPELFLARDFKVSGETYLGQFTELEDLSQVGSVSGSIGHPLTLTFIRFVPQPASGWWSRFTNFFARRSTRSRVAGISVAISGSGESTVRTVMDYDALEATVMAKYRVFDVLAENKHPLAVSWRFPKNQITLMGLKNAPACSGYFQAYTITLESEMWDSRRISIKFVDRNRATLDVDENPADFRFQAKQSLTWQGPKSSQTKFMIMYKKAPGEFIPDVPKFRERYVGVTLNPFIERPCVGVYGTDHTDCGLTMVDQKRWDFGKEDAPYMRLVIHQFRHMERALRPKKLGFEVSLNNGSSTGFKVDIPVFSEMDSNALPIDLSLNSDYTRSDFANHQVPLPVSIWEDYRRSPDGGFFSQQSEIQFNGHRSEVRYAWVQHPYLQSRSWIDAWDFDKISGRVYSLFLWIKLPPNLASGHYHFRVNSFYRNWHGKKMFDNVAYTNRFEVRNTPTTYPITTIAEEGSADMASTDTMSTTNPYRGIWSLFSGSSRRNSQEEPAPNPAPSNESGEKKQRVTTIIRGNLVPIVEDEGVDPRYLSARRTAYHL